jgi:hypothetical protein
VKVLRAAEHPGGSRRRIDLLCQLWPFASARTSLRILSTSSLDLFLCFVRPVSLIDAPTCISITARDLLDLGDADNSEG